MGLPADVRAERLTPQQFAELAALTELTTRPTSAPSACRPRSSETLAERLWR